MLPDIILDLKKKCLLGLTKNVKTATFFSQMGLVLLSLIQSKLRFGLLENARGTGGLCSF